MRPPLPPDATSADWIAAFREDWCDRGCGSEATWTTDYDSMFKRLPKESPLTAEIIHDVVTTTTANTRQRVRATVAMSALAKFAKIEYDASRYRGKYNFFNPQNARELPTDDLIAALYSTIEDSHWRWVFAMMSVYGLRNHEVFLLDLPRLQEGDSIIRVLEGKTGPREVYPFPPEWFVAMECFRPLLPNVDLTRNHSALGRSVTKYFRQPRAKDREPLPFAPYNLRHRWAVRTMEFGLEATLAAQQMGHSLQVHNGIYRKWIDRAVHARAYEKILANPNRPQAASIPPKP